MRVTRFLTVTPGLALTINQAGTSLAGHRHQPDRAHPPPGGGLGRPARQPHGAAGQLQPVRRHRRGPRRAPRPGRRRLARVPLQRRPPANTTSTAATAGGLPGRTIGLPCGPQGYDADGSRCREKLKTPRTTELTAGRRARGEPGPGPGRRLHLPRATATPTSAGRPTASGTTRARRWRPPAPTATAAPRPSTTWARPADARRRYLAVTASLKKREGRAQADRQLHLEPPAGQRPQRGGQRVGQHPPARRLPVGQPAQRPPPRGARLGRPTRRRAGCRPGCIYTYYSGAPYSRRYRNPVTGRNDNYRARIGINPGTDINDPGDDRELRLPDQQAFNLQMRANLEPLHRAAARALRRHPQRAGAAHHDGRLHRRRPLLRPAERPRRHPAHPPGPPLPVLAAGGQCARQSLGEEEAMSESKRRKPFVGTLRVTNPARQSLASSRKRVLRGAGATRAAKRRQRVSGPCD